MAQERLLCNQVKKGICALDGLIFMFYIWPKKDPIETWSRGGIPLSVIFLAELPEIFFITGQKVRLFC